MKVIAYSLFGYNDITPKNCFDFHAYLRGVMINLRVNRLLFPTWKMFIALDAPTYNGEYKPLFDKLSEQFGILYSIQNESEPLCTKMLWRMLPVFKKKQNDCAMFSHVLCRDLDAVGTYREAQAVQEWIDEEHTLHCITDSISHNIPMMGGMIGIHSESFWDRAGIRTWEELHALTSKYNMAKKGADQKLLNNEIYPKVCHSATEHFVKGMNWNKPESDGRHYRIDEGYPIDLNADYKISNASAGHIGAAGFYERELFTFLNQFDVHADEYKNIESDYKHIFFWANT